HARPDVAGDSPRPSLAVQLSPFPLSPETPPGIPGGRFLLWPAPYCPILPLTKYQKHMANSLRILLAGAKGTLGRATVTFIMFRAARATRRRVHRWHRRAWPPGSAYRLLSRIHTPSTAAAHSGTAAAPAKRPRQGQSRRGRGCSRFARGCASGDPRSAPDWPPPPLLRPRSA